MSEENTPNTEQMISRAERSRHVDKRQKWQMFAMAMVMMVFAIALLLLYVDTRGAAEQSAQVAQSATQDKVEVASEARQALCGTTDKEIYDRELCEKWASIEAEETPAVPAVPSVVIGGPSQAEIVEAFRVYCQDGNCKGRDGAEPTPADIAEAFATFCADGRCTGPTGANGTGGVDAPPPSPEMMLAAVTTYCADGRCIGPAGPQGEPPSADTVFAAVAAYCGTGACTGPKGSDGSPGQQGEQGEPGAVGPAPASITFTDQTGTTYTCVPDPPGSTTYTCTAPALEPKP